MGLEDRAGVPLAAQLIGAREAGYPAADNRNFLAGVISGRPKLQSVFKGVVADELLDRIDADMILDLVAVAAVFTR